MILIRLFYNILYVLFLLLQLVHLFFRAIKHPVYYERLKERFGFVPVFKENTKKSTEVYWVHAISAGETIAAKNLILALLQQRDINIVLTNHTPAGSKVARDIFSKEIATGRILLSYFPYDLPCCRLMAIKRWQPSCLILIETDLWLNLLYYCSQHKITIILVNGRISEHSIRRRRFRWVNRLLVQKIDYVIAQYSKDAEHFRQCGVPEDRLEVTGNIKLDKYLDTQVINEAGELLKNWRITHKEALIIVCGSTHEGEEKILLDCLQTIQKDSQQAILMVLVPRHFERFEEVRKLALSYGFNVWSHSKGCSLNADTQVLIVDTIGELLKIFGTADIVFLGGSLVPMGGHDFVEPSLWSKPIISGSHLFNFANLAQYLNDSGGLRICENSIQVTERLLDLINHPELRLSMGKATLATIEKNRGSLNRTLDCILRITDKHH